MFKYQGHDYYRCQLCGLVSTHPFPDSATLEAHYFQKFNDGNYRLIREYANEYIRIYNGFVQILECRLQSRQIKWRGLKVLDIGCFTGEFLQLLQDRGAECYGVEFQSQAVEIANQKFPGRVFKGDAFSNEFPSMHFDVITLLGVIEHVLEPVRLLRRCSALLNPGGILMLQTPNSASFLARIMRQLWPPYAPIEHIHIFSAKSLNTCLSELGFEEIIHTSHWKRLPISYVYANSKNFGAEFYRWFKPLFLPLSKINISLPFYIGEIVVAGRKT